MATGRPPKIDAATAQIRDLRESGERVSTVDLAYLKVFDGTAQAAARMKAQAIASVYRAAREKWRPAAWWLERKYPDEIR